jgi:predicted transcriptional regulator
MPKKRTAKSGTNERGTTSVSVRLSDELLTYLDERAASENRSRANLIETLLKQVQEQAGK